MAVPALTVSVETPPVVTDAGASAAVEPEGAPDTVRVTVCETPETKATAIADVPDLAGARLKLAGLAEMEKSLLTVEITFSATVVECVPEGAVP